MTREFIYFMGFIRFFIVLNHYFLMLLRIEFIIIGLYFMVSFYFKDNFLRLDFVFIFLRIIIIEGVLGLCILIFISRLKGGESFAYNYF